MSSIRRPNYRIIKRVSFTFGLLFVAAGLLINVNYSSAAGGAIDPTFNADGTGADVLVRALAVQPDGKIVIGGDFTSYNGDAAAPDGVMRLNADGTRDTTFNAVGPGANGVVRAVALQPDGKMVIGGDFTSYNDDAAAPNGVIRLNADGTLDPTFNAGGAGANGADVRAVAVQPDGKIVIGGAFFSYNGNVAAPDNVLRLNADGTRDGSFNL
ncbi:MAG TPA: delta-60 repeat domain-containing protein, partial [Pyrinomonadaceae bacterium]|nr:delta-60 repeat domain-containing protein [Pyrinomonadaceae bacterium]